MNKPVRTLIQGLARRLGYDIVRYQPDLFRDVGEEDIQTIRSIEAYTMVSPQATCALVLAVRYVVQNNVPGDIVECGVWRGGSMMAVARTLRDLNHSDKHLYLFDTFEGMPTPSAADVTWTGDKASTQFEKTRIDETRSSWLAAPLEEVKAALYSTGYDRGKIHFVKGKVEDTIPENAPERISLLRLDTDFYESTRHELVHLYPRLSPGGAIVIDDYGYWQGARKAVDEYIEENHTCLFLNRVDQIVRVGIKCG